MTTRVALVMAPLLSLIHMGAGNMGAFKVCVCENYFELQYQFRMPRCNYFGLQFRSRPCSSAA